MDHNSVLLEEPLTREPKLGIRSQLEDYWKFRRRHIVFSKGNQVSWLHSDSMRILDEEAPQLNPTKLSYFYNKPKTLYITPSGQRDNLCPMIIFGCIFLHYDNEPNIEFGHFFADPVRITSNGPNTVVEIVRSHKLLCNQASHLLNRLRRGEDIYPYCTPSAKSHKLLPLCRAIILVLDELDQDVEGDEDGCVSLDKYSQAQSVFMVQTGNESHLSPPMTFEQIKVKTPPLRRDDWILEDIEVVRASLTIAADFIANVQQKEEAAFPSKMNGHVINRSLCPAD